MVVRVNEGRLFRIVLNFITCRMQAFGRRLLKSALVMNIVSVTIYKIASLSLPVKCASIPQTVSSTIYTNISMDIMKST